MYTKQTIAFIGVSGKKASAILKNIAGGNYRLLLASVNNEQLQPLIDEIKAQHPFADVEITDCSFNACWEADLIIAAIPSGGLKAFTDKIKQVANRKIVISIADLLDNDSFENIDLKSLLPNTFAATIYSAAFVAAFLGYDIVCTNSEVLISGDEEAISATSALITAAGYIPVVANHFAEF